MFSGWPGQCVYCICCFSHVIFFSFFLLFLLCKLDRITLCKCTCMMCNVYVYSHFYYPTLFLDTPSTTKILPLVHPSSLQITSRGRVVFNIMPSGQMGAPNDVTSYISFLSPEYLNSIGKKITFVESDIEKVTGFYFCLPSLRLAHIYCI